MRAFGLLRQEFVIIGGVLGKVARALVVLECADVMRLWDRVVLPVAASRTWRVALEARGYGDRCYGHGPTPSRESVRSMYRFPTKNSIILYVDGCFGGFRLGEYANNNLIYINSTTDSGKSRLICGEAKQARRMAEAVNYCPGTMPS